MSKQFPQGIRVFKPNEKAPTWIKLNLEVTKKDFIEWINSQPGEVVKLEVKESKKETLYVDTVYSNKNGLPF